MKIPYLSVAEPGNPLKLKSFLNDFYWLLFGNLSKIYRIPSIKAIQVLSLKSILNGYEKILDKLLN